MGVTDAPGRVTDTRTLDAFGKLLGSTGNNPDPFRAFAGFGSFWEAQYGGYSSGGAFFDPGLGLSQNDGGSVNGRPGPPSNRLRPMIAAVDGEGAAFLPGGPVNRSPPGGESASPKRSKAKRRIQMADYVKTNEGDLVIQLNDHAAGVATHGATVGLSAGEITQAATDAQTASHAVNGQSLYKSKSQEWTEYKALLLYAPINTPVPSTPAPPVVGVLPLGALAAVVARFRQRAERIKAHPSYTPAIGEDCRIVAPVPPPPGTPKPVLSGTAQTDYAVRLTFAMAGHDQIEIYSKRGNETEWTLLTVDTNNPYTDGRAPLVANTPEVRQYRARYRDDDQPVGDWSDTVTITAQA